MAHEPKPPFEIYHDRRHIADANGHLCSADNPEIARATLNVLRGGLARQRGSKLVELVPLEK